MNKVCIYISAFFFLLYNHTFSQRVAIGMKNGVSYTDINGRFAYTYFEDAEIVYNKIDYWGNGVKWNISKWKVNSSGYLKPTLGLIMNYQIHKHLTLQSELNYEEKGFDFIHTRIGMGCSGYYKFNYLTIPALLNYEIGRAFKFYLYEGVSFNFLLQTKNYIIVSSYSTNPFETGTVYNESYYASEINKKEVEAALGMGTKIPISSRTKFIIDARYSTGITRAVKNTFNNPHTFQNVFNRSVTLSWGVLIQINNKNKSS